ncbi:MAG TPA: glycosyltransferase family 39 protein [Patescibacteria group bacterium]|nr:glycosyltransferase family 39 protein [Patescibacteria group bacterium]
MKTQLQKAIPQTRMMLFVILMVSILIRILAAIYLGDSTPAGKDETSYSLLAGRLTDGFGYSFAQTWYPFAPAGEPTAHWSFLYTAFVAAIYAVFGFHPLAVRLISALAGGVLLPWMVYRLTRRLAPERPNLALISAACAGIYAYFILFSAMLMTETFYIVAILFSLERALALEQQLQSGERPRWALLIGFGMSLGLATLLRQSILPWLVILFAWLLWAGWRSKNLQLAIHSLLVSGFVLLMFILPFTIRNYRVYGDFLLLNSNAGYAMYSAQHPLHGTNFQAYTAAPLPVDVDPFPKNEAQWDKVLMQRGIEFIIQDPGRYLLLSVSRAADYFMFWPSNETSPINNIGRVLSFGLFLPVMIYGLLISRHQWRRFELLYIFILFYSVLHLMTWSMIRYRLPVDALLLIFAAFGILDLTNKMPALRKWARPELSTKSKP